MSSRIDIVPSKELNLTRRVIPRVTARIRPTMVFYNSRTLFDDTFDFANGYSYKRRRGMDTYYLKKNHLQKESSPPVPDDVNDDVNDERPAVG